MSTVGNVQKRIMNNNNEIDVMELFYVIMKKKQFIFFMALVGIIIGIVYIKSSHPVYEARALVSPPSLSQIQPLNLGRTIKEYSLLIPFTRTDIYAIFRESLGSESTKKNFLSQISLSSDLNENKTNSSHQVFHSISVIASDRDPLGKQFVIVKHEDAKKAANLAKVYVELANQKAINELKQIIQAQNETVVQELKSRISASRSINKEQWETLNMKYSLDQSNDQSIEGNSNVPSNPVNRGEFSKSSHTESRATKTNKTYLAHLNKDLDRVDDGARTRKMMENYIFYKNIKAESTASLYQLEGGGHIPTSLISPHRKLILMVSTLLGLLIGMSIVVLKAIIAERKTLS